MDKQETLQVSAQMKWKRIEFIDMLRGIAVVLMVAYHVVFDLMYFGKVEIECKEFWFWTPRIIGGMFIFISGISLTLARRKYGNKLFRVYLRKGAKYLTLAMLISLVTLPTGCYVRFGIMHFFGVAAVVGSLFSKFRFEVLCLGMLLVLLGFIFNNLSVDSECFIWLGILPKEICTLDHYPLIPWLGVLFLGIFAGNTFNFDIKISRVFVPLVKIGRRTLLIYILQHPVILLLMQLYYGDVLQQVFRSLT